MTEALPRTRADAIRRYIEIMPRLPDATSPDATVRARHLEDLLDEFDAFVLDGFGVVNVGDSAVPGAVERVRALQSAGKRVLILTNGATAPSRHAAEKYRRWGFELDADDVISSRDALERALADGAVLADTGAARWGVIAPERSDIASLPGTGVRLIDADDDWERVDGFVLLSTGDWSKPIDRRLRRALERQSRPLLVGNPDLVAPWEGGLSIEPGWHAHALQDAGLAEPRFFGKPFREAFELVAARLPDVAPQRICMVGDTLHTDILGGAAFGWRTVLVIDHGLYRETDLEAWFDAAGIRPDFAVDTT